MKQKVWRNVVCSLLLGAMLFAFVPEAKAAQGAKGVVETFRLAPPAESKKCVNLDVDWAHLHLGICTWAYAGKKGVYIDVQVKGFGASTKFRFDIVKNNCFGINPTKLVGNLKYCVTNFKRVNQTYKGVVVGYTISFTNQVKFCLSYWFGEKCKGTDKWDWGFKFP